MIDPKASDWSDLDLLTTAEATERVVAEIGSVESEIAELDNPDTADADALAALRRRLSALRERLPR
ncbi:MAG TPA: hypothetical protein VN888_11225 [Mycobacterium sp.]|nr:hypothetical protein [Mycobacterium sp.]